MSVAICEAALAPAPVRDVEDLDRRDALITQYRPYVYKIARSVAAHLSVHTELDDLAGWGFLGLIDAATRFDAGRGISFRTFAHWRIRGAILDGLRFEFGGSARASREWQRYTERASSPSSLCADAAYSGFDVVEHFDWRDLLGTEPPDRSLWLLELRDRLEHALEVLTPLEREILERHYVCEESVQAFAAERNMSKSWLSRVHRRALAKLREHLANDSMGREAFV